MTAPSLPHLRRARDLIDQRYREPQDVGVLAGEAGYSPFHFVRIFRATFGETPRQYLSRRRVERAKDLLRHSNLTVTEICFLVGFSSLGSFSSRFRTLVGRTPTDYRRYHVERGGPPPIPGCFVLAWSRPGEPDTAIEEKHLGQGST